MSFLNDTGILTLATRNDYKKAIGLSLSIRHSKNEFLVSVVCNSMLANKLESYFDKVILERDNLRGFEHKLFLDQYSPYEKTLFLDADILVFDNLNNWIERLRGNSYTARGWCVDSGKSSFGLNRKKVLRKINKKKLVCISGAGHAYFEKPKCIEIFDVAREIMTDYQSYCKGCKLADEDVMAIAMTICNITPFENNGFLGSPLHARKGTFDLDIESGRCQYFDEKLGFVSPAVLHFMRKAMPFTYAKELNNLNRIYRKNDITLYFDAIRDWVNVYLFWKLKAFLKKYRVKQLR